MRILACILGAFLSLSMVGCDHLLTDSEQVVELESLEFTSETAEPGNALVLVGQRSSGTEKDNLPVSVTTSSEAQSIIDLSDSCFNPDAERRFWGECSEEELIAIMKEADLDNRAFVGFKEEDMDRGVSETGEVLVSDQTKESMIQWLNSLDGVEERRVFELTPAMTVSVTLDTDLLRTIREHPNVDYFEPILPGEYLSDGSGGTEAGPLFGIIPTTTEGAEALRVEPGDIVTATYEQSDGSLLEASISIE